jgi:pilus assembly protein CpaB
VGKLMVVVAVVLGAFAVYVIHGQFDALRAEANPPTQRFYRATGDVAPGMLVSEATSDSVRLILPTTELPQGFARAYPYAINEASIGAFRTKKIERPVKAGEFLQQAHLEPLSNAEILATIPAGKKVVAIGVSAQSAVGYLVSPGDVVDVYVTSTRQDPEAPGGVVPEARVAVPDVTVYAVDNVIARQDGVPVRPRGAAYQTVSVIVDPDQAATLIALLTQGKATLALKSRKPAP